MSLQVPLAVVGLFRSKGCSGTSLDLQNARAHVRELWGTRSNVKGGVRLWRSRQGRCLTVVARMRPCAARDLVLHVLREAGRHFRANSLATWRPHVLLALGLLAEPVDELEAMDPVAVHRTWPSARALATKLQERPEPSPERSTDEQDSAEAMDDSSSTSSTDSSSSGSDSGDESPAATPASSPTRTTGPSTTATGSTSGSSSSAPAGSSAPADDARLSSEQGQLVQKLLRSSNAGPRRVLGLLPRDGSKQARLQYLNMVRMIHPDKCDVPGATAAFQIVQKAYEVAQHF